ncbi:GLPGLI family protein [Polaribacter sp.]|uniref:GLPGLI family protein n=1 Tax=Polaribacter sp. TaxID=1920175 RepID=UPI003F6A58FE
MKNSLLLFLILILSSKSLMSQENTLFTITYAKIFNSKLDTTKTREYKNQINNLNILLNKYSKEVSYKLSILNHTSMFEPNKFKMENSNDRIKALAGSIGGTKGKFYINKKDSIFLNKKHFGGEDFVVKMNVKKWEILSEFKFINNFKCYKAIFLDSNSKRNSKKEVIAWFCPELPSFFGPSLYFGLPGLILELDNGKIILKVKEITIKKGVKKSNFIKPFDKGIVLTENEFKKIVRKKAEEQFGKYLKN